MTEVLNQVKEALENATPGPWLYLAEVNRCNEKAPIGFGFVYVREVDESKTVISGDIKSLGNLQLIANAPEWLFSLITNIESLQTEYADERTAHNEHVAELLEAEKLVKSQKEEIEKWREFGKVTVQWYKDQGHPITAINAQAKLEWISYTSTLCEIERQANAFIKEGKSHE